MPRSRLLPLLTLVVLLAVPVTAGAATRDVCPAGCTYTSIQAAVAAADPGDTVSVSPGTYNETQVLINKPLTLQGAGPGQSIIDGGQATGLPLSGTVRVETGAGNVTVDGFTIRNAGADAAGTKIALQEKSPTYGPTFRFTDLRLEGLGVVGQFDRGFYSYNSFADVIFAGNVVRQTGGNPVTFEQHRGSSDVYDNDVAPLSTGSGSAIAFFTYGDADVVAPQRVRDNLVSTTGIAFTGAFQNIAGTGRFTGPEVTGNVVSGIASGNGISISDADTSLGGAEGRIKDAVVRGNIVTGSAAAAASGIRAFGAVTGTTITGNSVSGFQNGVRAQVNAGGAPTGTVVSFNRIVGNSNAGLLNDGLETIDATRNWWGCNEGPGAAGCDPVTGPVDVDPWLVFTVGSGNTSIATGGDSTNITARLQTDSEGALYDNADFPNGFPVTFSTTLGSVTPASTPLRDAVAFATLTSGTQAGTATVSAVFDNETVTTPVAITEACPGGDLDGDGTNDACDADDDGDGLDDSTETQVGTDPRKADSDGDAVGDRSDACPTISGGQANGCPATTTTGGDDRPPTVTLTSPREGAILGTTTPTRVTAEASDDKGVAVVRFVVGNRVVCTDTAAPYECAYEPTGGDVGKASLLAVATDSAGQIGLSAREVTVGRFSPGALSATTTPARDRSRPYTFTTTGRLTLPSGVTPAQGCSGEVSVQFKIGTRTISNRRARVGADCRYRSTVAFRGRRSPTTLRVRARFHGSRVMAPRVGAFRTVRLG